jgi:uncharacterized protein (TIGR02271 family)
MTPKRSNAHGSDPVDSAVTGEEKTPSNALRLPLAEETLEAQVVDRRLGTVRIHKRVETQPVQAQVELYHDEMAIDHLAVDEVAKERRVPWYEGDTLMIPVYEEVLVTETKLVLKEIIRLHNRGRVEQVNLRGTVRRELVEIEETEP